MKVKVLRRYRDAENGKFYVEGDIVEYPDVRANALISRKFVEAVKEPKKEPKAEKKEPKTAKSAKPKKTAKKKK